MSHFIALILFLVLAIIPFLKLYAVTFSFLASQLYIFINAKPILLFFSWKLFLSVIFLPEPLSSPQIPGNAVSRKELLFLTPQITHQSHLKESPIPRGALHVSIWNDIKL